MKSKACFFFSPLLPSLYHTMLEMEGKVQMNFGRVKNKGDHPRWYQAGEDLETDPQQEGHDGSILGR